MTDSTRRPIESQNEWRQFKSDAYQRKQETGHSHSQMLEIMARERGYNTYAALREYSVREHN
jgi:hypothetical protein